MSAVYKGCQGGVCSLLQPNLKERSYLILTSFHPNWVHCEATQFAAVAGISQTIRQRDLGYLVLIGRTHG